MSMWAQLYLRVKFSRKQAAVTLAPPGVAMLARSAKFDLSWSLYASSIGRRHAVSLGPFHGGRIDRVHATPPS